MRNIPFGKPLIGDEERAAVLDVLNGPVLTHGPRVVEFETAFARYTEAPHAVAVGSCTAAMHLAWLHLGLKPGDEVLVPAQTHVATAHAVEYCGARPVFIDSECKTGNVDLDHLESKITPRTRAIAVVHYLGLPVDMDRAAAIARRHNLFLLEDCALALGTRLDGRHAGLMGDAGCFSFYPVKHITTAEGGMLITRDPDIARRVSQLRAFGIDRNVVHERAIPGLYDVQALGFNYRLNELGAALGLAQMKRVPDILRRRRENYHALAAGLRELNEIELFSTSHGHLESSYYCLSLLLKETHAARRNDLMEHLKNHGVGVSVYYPRAVPQMTYYAQKYPDQAKSCPVASGISARSIALPVGPHVEADDISCMVQAIKDGLAAL